MALMRAKMKVESVQHFEKGEQLTMRAVSKSGQYPEDGKDEDNSFARFTPSAELNMYISNPDLEGSFKPGDTFYVDFTKAE